TGVEGLKNLKEGGIPDSVIKVMINPTAAGPTVVAASGSTPMTVDPNLPPPEVGVYWKDRANFVLLQGQALTNTKAGGKAGSLFTNGMRNQHWDARTGQSATMSGARGGNRSGGTSAGRIYDFSILE
ncbi:MAG TPA: hypothetical protein VN933_17770, partial [Candidatus Eremiobacteraceae bacterium]|nr:hypothetical protein [Candidatus Eremiobacteraceae bacterium]